MRLCCIILLVVCLLSVVANSSAIVHPGQASIAAHNLRHSNTVLERRALKSYVDEIDSEGNQGNNERAYIPGLSPIAGTLLKISPSSQKLANKLWLKSKTNPEQVFNTLRLGKASVKLEDNPRFLQWLNYVDMYSNLRNRLFTDNDVLKLLQKSNSAEELVALFQSLRKIPNRKPSAEYMQILLFEESASSRKLLNEAWLKSGDTPEEVFNILRLQKTKITSFKLEYNSIFLPWFKYTKMYHGTSAVGDLQTYKFLRSRYATSEFELAPLFQLLKQTRGMDALGENLQSFLFLSWTEKGFKPKFVQNQMSASWGGAIFELPKDHVFYRALEEYTIFYTARRGGEQVIKTVRGLFANNKLDKALAAASKV